MGAEISVESSVGTNVGFSDEDYRQAGAKIVSDKIELLEFADVVLRVQKPLLSEVQLLKPGSIHVSFLDPFNEPDLVMH